ncbi:alpha beta-hydrolase [Fusarium heterosporum]|uniref:Alpha beta-hydrolase n=1 Tax=Fusarium heterosporum TaxID=42747 RepID=A0A8H5WJ59_FUSHE|nr:alpha beta-hydrolase [Fusarium heterosporum]
MGCSSSTPVGDDPRAPRPARKNQAHEKPNFENLTLPEVTWERIEEWSDIICDYEKNAIEAGRQDEFSDAFNKLLYVLMRSFLETLYPECESNDTIEDLGLPHVCMSAGPCSGDDGCEFFTGGVTVYDASGSGIVHASATMVAKLSRHSNAAEGHDTTAPGTKEQPRLVPGADIDSLEMRGAKRAALQQLSYLKSNGVNARHASVFVFVGADCFSCRFDPSPKPPTITPLTLDRPKILTKTMNEIVQDTKRAPDLFRGMFAPTWFRQVVRDMSLGFEGSTVWDEGQLPFKLPNGRMYHQPTRLLVTRVYKKMTEGVEEMTFTVTPPLFPGDSTPSDSVTLVRKVDPTKEPGGIVRIALIIGIDKGVVWPKIDDYSKTSTMAAGEKAVLEYAKRLYEKGIIERCGIRVYMGTDESLFKLIGDPQTSNSQERRLPHHSEMKEIAAAPRMPQQPLEDRSLATDFNLSISVQPQHALWASESQFQAVKRYMAEKAKTETPEELYKQAMVTMPSAAKRYLDHIFPGCEISIEGAFPVVLPDGTESGDSEAILVVARDLKQEPTSVVAAINVVPCPSGPGDGSDLWSDKVWIDTPQMKAADDRLLELLKRWHVQGKVSKLDCMAQTMMAKDVTIYKFVDGERFEDYSDERMQQLNWG